MYLLNTSSLELKEFISQPPRYAILSHTWEDEEILFKDIQDLGKASQKKGYGKIRDCCMLAASEGYEYIWIDTCCIDKSSSAELSEAINSMFSYYQNSEVCYVYLDKNFPTGSVTVLSPAELRSTRWVHRGWTLQELIAPTNVHFYDRQWAYCGTREDLTFPLIEVTNIDLEKLSTIWSTGMDVRHAGFSIAERMSWASRRQTTRPEDLAYCLFGIFDVHLPPLYGEGAQKAFLRLQEAIIKDSTDLTILAWSVNDRISPTELAPVFGALARSPAWFAHGRSVAHGPATVEPFRMTNKGLRVKLPLIDFKDDPSKKMNKSCIAVLPNCLYARDTQLLVGIRLRASTRSTAAEHDWFRENFSWSQDSSGRWRPDCVVKKEDLMGARVCKIYLR